MHNLFISPMLKAVSKVWPQLLRGYYTSQRLDAFLKLDISSSGGGVQFYFHSQEGMCYLTAANMSPFDFTIDRMEVNITNDGGSFSCVGLMPQLVKATSSVQIFARSHCPMLAEAAQRAKISERSRIEIVAHIITPIRGFTIRRNLSDVRNVEVHI